MRNPLIRIRHILERRARTKTTLTYGRDRPDLDCDLSFTEATKRFASRNDLYAYLHRYFSTRLPEPLRAHRAYFEQNGRGFGEAAFHSMWYLLLKEFKPTQLLEIGVFRGQVISLWALIGRTLSLPIDIRCISPFSQVSDQVSAYPVSNYLEDVLQNFRHFGLQPPDYCRALSTDAKASAYLQEKPLDCVYIDGSHDYEVVLSDYRGSVATLKTGGLLIMDDSSLDTDFAPPVFAFAGHPGPSRVARELADRELIHLGGVGHQNVYRKP
jgi:hypothetical protein